MALFYIEVMTDSGKVCIRSKSRSDLEKPDSMVYLDH